MLETQKCARVDHGVNLCFKVLDNTREEKQKF